MIRAAFATALLLVGCAESTAPPPQNTKADGRAIGATSARPSLGAGSLPRRYAALGDSFTIGTGTTPDRSFPARLAARFPNATLLNLGVNGFRATDVIDRELPQAATFGPDFVTLAIGANDIVRGGDVERYRADVRAILSPLTRHIKPCRILVLPQPAWADSPMGRSFASPDALRAQIARFNDVLMAEARAAGARWLDLRPLMAQQATAGMLAPDGLHPSADAYEAWSDAIVSSLHDSPLCDP